MVSNIAPRYIKRAAMIGWIDFTFYIGMGRLNHKEKSIHKNITFCTCEIIMLLIACLFRLLFFVNNHHDEVCSKEP